MYHFPGLFVISPTWCLTMARKKKTRVGLDTALESLLEDEYFGNASDTDRDESLQVLIVSLIVMPMQMSKLSHLVVQHHHHP